MSKHTPGPWLTQDIEIDGDERGQCFVIGSDCGGLVGAALPWPTELDTGDLSRVEANARLIAAAPELLVELQQALRQWEFYADSYEGGAGRDIRNEPSAEGDLYRHALAVVAKATGGDDD